MANWKDPDIRNHVSGDITNLRIGGFMQDNIFYSNTSKRYYPYKLKDMHMQPSLIYRDINREKMKKNLDITAEAAPRYRFANTSNYKPMQDCYYAIGNVYLYQIILNINNLWSLLEYHDENLPKVLIPYRHDITNLFRRLMNERHFRNIYELNTPEKINDAIMKTIIDTEVDYHIVDIAKEKMYLNYDDIQRRLKSPLITKYLNRVLSKLVENKDIINDTLLTTIITNILRRLRIYIKDSVQYSNDVDYR